VIAHADASRRVSGSDNRRFLLRFGGLPAWPGQGPKKQADLRASNLSNSGRKTPLFPKDGKYVAKEWACPIACAEQDSARVYVSACVS